MRRLRGRGWRGRNNEAQINRHGNGNGNLLGRLRSRRRNHSRLRRALNTRGRGLRRFAGSGNTRKALTETEGRSASRRDGGSAGEGSAATNVAALSGSFGTSLKPAGSIFGVSGRKDAKVTFALGVLHRNAGRVPFFARRQRSPPGEARAAHPVDFAGFEDAFDEGAHTQPRSPCLSIGRSDRAASPTVRR